MILILTTMQALKVHTTAVLDMYYTLSRESLSKEVVRIDSRPQKEQTVSGGVSPEPWIRYSTHIQQKFDERYLMILMTPKNGHYLHALRIRRCWDLTT